MSKTRLQPDMPLIDTRIEHVGVSRLRQLDGKALRENVQNKALVIRDHDTPLAVLLSYEQYLSIQNQLQTVIETLEILSSSEELTLLKQGMREVQSGQSRSLEEIRASLHHKPE